VPLRVSSFFLHHRLSRLPRKAPPGLLLPLAPPRRFRNQLGRRHPRRVLYLHRHRLYPGRALPGGRRASRHPAGRVRGVWTDGRAGAARVLQFGGAYGKPRPPQPQYLPGLTLSRASLPRPHTHNTRGPRASSPTPVSRITNPYLPPSGAYRVPVPGRHHLPHLLERRVPSRQARLHNRRALRLRSAFRLRAPPAGHCRRCGKWRCGRGARVGACWQG
jgi:hypothetical protein